MAAGLVIAGLITTVAPTTTAQTLKTDLMPPHHVLENSTAVTAVSSAAPQTTAFTQSILASSEGSSPLPGATGLDPAAGAVIGQGPAGIDQVGEPDPVSVPAGVAAGPVAPGIAVENLPPLRPSAEIETHSSAAASRSSASVSTTGSSGEDPVKAPAPAAPAPTATPATVPVAGSPAHPGASVVTPVKVAQSPSDSDAAPEAIAATVGIPVPAPAPSLVVAVAPSVSAPSSAPSSTPSVTEEQVQDVLAPRTTHSDHQLPYPPTRSDAGHVTGK